MIESLSTATGVAVPPSSPTGAAASASAAAPPSPTPAEPIARLYVQDDGVGGYVYQLVNVVTGRLLAEVPRERVQDLKDVAGYTAGALVTARV